MKMSCNIERDRNEEMGERANIRALRGRRKKRKDRAQKIEESVRGKWNNNWTKVLNGSAETNNHRFLCCGEAVTNALLSERVATSNNCETIFKLFFFLERINPAANVGRCQHSQGALERIRGSGESCGKERQNCMITFFFACSFAYFSLVCSFYVATYHHE